MLEYTGKKTARQIDDGSSEANISPNLSRIIDKMAQMPQMQTFIAICVFVGRSWLIEGKSFDTFIATHHTHNELRLLAARRVTIFCWLQTANRAKEKSLSAINYESI